MAFGNQCGPLVQRWSADVRPSKSLPRRVAGFVLVSLLAMPGLAAANETRRPVDHVDPLIDSANSRWFFFSSACRPFGMVNLSPDMNTNAWWKSGYLYHADTICSPSVFLCRFGTSTVSIGRDGSQWSNQ